MAKFYSQFIEQLKQLMINGEYYLRRKYGDDKAMKKILDEYIETVEFIDFVLSEAILCVEYYSEADFYFNLEQQLLSVLNENNVNITDKVMEFVDEYIMDNIDYIVDYIPDEIIEILANE